MKIIAEFNDYRGLIVALRQAKEHRGVSFATLDDLADLADNFSAKVLGPRPARKLSMVNIGRFLSGLGVKCQVVDDPTTFDVKLGKIRNKSQVRAEALHLVINRRVLRTAGVRGGKARWANLSPSERSAQARAFANARWAAISPDRRSEILSTQWRLARARRAARKAAEEAENASAG